jgi:hypothetical protein
MTKLINQIELEEAVQFLQGGRAPDPLQHLQAHFISMLKHQVDLLLHREIQILLGIFFQV